MLTTRDLRNLMGRAVHGSDGAEIGPAQQVYFDNETQAPEWITVRTGHFAAKESFLPLTGARAVGDHIEVPFSRAQVGEAPRIEPHGELTEQEEMQLWRHYGVGPVGRVPAGMESAMARGGTSVGRAAPPGPAGAPGAGPRHAAERAEVREAGRYGVAERAVQEASMTRFEERLTIAKRTEEIARVRLRKYVVTEEQQVGVPVTREEVRLEREPLTDVERERMRSAGELGEDQQEIILYAEQPVVGTETVPVERVRLSKEAVTEHRTVTGQVRKEIIDVEPGGQRYGPGRGR